MTNYSMAFVKNVSVRYARAKMVFLLGNASFSAYSLKAKINIMA